MVLVDICCFRGVILSHYNESFYRHGSRAAQLACRKVHLLSDQKWMFRAAGAKYCQYKPEILHRVRSPVPKFHIYRGRNVRLQPQKLSKFRLFSTNLPPRATPLHNFYEIFSVYTRLGVDFIVAWKPILYLLFGVRKINLSGIIRQSTADPNKIRYGQVKGWQRSGNLGRDRTILGKMGAGTSYAEPECFCAVIQTTFRHSANLMARKSHHMSLGISVLRNSTSVIRKEAFLSFLQSLWIRRNVSGSKTGQTPCPINQWKRCGKL